MRIAGILLALILGLCVVLVLSVPLLARWQVQQVLVELFAEPSEVDAVTLSPFKGRLGISGIRIGNAIQLDRVDLQLRLAPLWDRHLHVLHMNVEGLRLPVAFKESALQISQLQIPFKSGTGDESGEAALSWQLDRLSLQAAVVEASYQANTHRVNLESLTLAQLSSNFAAPVAYAVNLSSGASKLSLQGQVQLQPNLVIEQQAQLELLLADVQAYLPVPLQGRLILDQQMTGGVTNSVQRLSLAGSLQLDNLAYSGSSPASAEQVAWQGNADVILGEELQLAARGQLSATAISMAPLLSVAQVRLQGVHYEAGQLRLADADIDGLDAILRRLESGKLADMPPFLQPQAVTGQAPETGQQDSAGLQVFIDQAALTGKLTFTDESVSPPVNIKVQAIDLQAKDLGPGKKASILLTANHQEENQSGTLALEGEGFWLDQPINGDLQVQLSEFELHQLSAYLDNGIQSGRLNLTSTVAIADNHLKAQNRVKIAGLKVNTRAAQATTGTDMPLSLALDLLKDKDDRIDLQVPVETDFDTFSVDTGDIVRTALSAAAMRGAFAFAKQALQPLGSLMLLKDVAQAATRPRFQPLTFAPGSSELAGDQQVYADKLIALMQARPALRLTVCGIATGRDLAALLAAAGVTVNGVAEGEQPTPEELTPALLALAEARGKILRRAMADGGVAIERLFACQPAFEAKDTAPRVKLSL